MAQARHIGKVVLTMPARPRERRAARRPADATYLVTGGLGGLGLEVARWLVERGARALVLVGRQRAHAGGDGRDRAAARATARR